MERLTLAHLPTALHSLPRLSEYLGGPEIWIKRDDNTGLALGGNKARKLEYLLADALNQGANLVITAGGIQSNHARMTAAAAARLGLECHLVLRGTLGELQGNLLLDKMFGAIVHLVEPGEDREAHMEGVAKEARRAGKKPYIIGVGGSNSLGSLGYVNAVDELVAQLAEPDYFDEMVVAVGSGGTYAGLLSGLRKHRIDSILRGIAVDDEEFAPIISDICSEAHRRYGLPAVTLEDITLERGYLGPGYGQPSPAGLEAINLMAKLEGILLDPVYTGKAMAGLIGLVRAGRYSANQRVLFWHTGGAPALFAFAQEVVSDTN